ncbi:autotransporter domain-containing protein [Aurantimonas endophytica]|nr:autotransporter domain-containing protein [Aurantimonas endophytica]
MGNGFLVVGDSSDGTLSIQAGGTVSNGDGAIAGRFSTTGTVTVTGAGSTWTNSGLLVVGSGGDGRLTVANGGVVRSDETWIAGGGLSRGAVVLDFGGVLETGQVAIGSGEGTFTFNGGTLRLTGDQNDLFSYLSPGSTILSGRVVLDTFGARIDTNGFDVSTGVALSGSGGLLKLGDGTLALREGGNYAGGTDIAGGTLTVSGLISNLVNGENVRVGVDDGSSGNGALLVADGGTISNTAGYIGSLRNSTGTSIATVTGVGSAWRNSRFLSVGEASSGALIVTDGGAVSNTDGYVGRLTDSTGAVTVAGDGSSWTNSGLLYVGNSGRGTLTVADGGVVSNTAGYVGTGPGGAGAVTVSGVGSTWTNYGRLFLGVSGDGTLTVADGGAVSNADAFVGTNSTGVATVTGAGSTWTNSGILYVGNGREGTVTVAEGGRISAAEAVIGAFGNGTLNIGAAAVETAAAAGMLDTATVNLGQGGTLVFNHNNNGDGTPLDFAPTIMGPGSIRHLAGTTTLTGTNTAAESFTGTLDHLGGTLWVNGTLGDTVDNRAQVNVSQFGALGGVGTIAGSLNVDGGGILLGTRGQTLTVDGDLVLGSGSTTNVLLGTPSSSALFDVGRDLTLDGTLSVTDAGGFGAGVYRLFDYGGTLTDEGMEIGTTPTGVAAADLSLQTSVPGRVNLVFSAGQDLGFWDGADAARHDNGAIDGGSGDWRADGRNWTDTTGAVNGPYRPNPTFAVFQGTGGTVAVDDNAGPISVSGMQFAADGYQIQGDPVGLAGANGETVVRVGDGSVDGAAMTATVASELVGSSRLVKADLGTLNLAGRNGYTGGTSIDGGTLRIDNADALGTGDINFTGAGILVADNTLMLANPNIVWGNDAAGTIAAANGTVLTLTPAEGYDFGDNATIRFGVAGAGGAVVIGHNPEFSSIRHRPGAQFSVDAGTLRVGSGRIGSSFFGNDGATWTVAADATLDLNGFATRIANLFGSGTVTSGAAAARLEVSGIDATEFSGVITDGAGPLSLTKEGTNTLTLSGANTYTGPTTIFAGGLSISGTGSITSDVTNDATFVNGGTVTGDVINNATFESSGILTGNLTNAGSVLAAGTIDGDVLNTDGALFTVRDTLGGIGLLTNDGAANLGDSALTVAGLAGSSSTATIDTGTGSLTFGGDRTSRTYAGAFTGSGTLTKRGTAVQVFSGNSSGFSGATSVTGGALRVEGSLGDGSSTVSVTNGGGLGGAGTIGGAVTIDDGSLIGVQGRTLSMNTVAFGATSIVDVTLGVPGDTALFDIVGDLTLDGTLNVTDAGGFGTGIYRLIEYGGDLTDLGLEVGATPTGVPADALVVQTAVAGVVNLVSAAGSTLSFWDGDATTLHDNGTVDGGSGTWRAAGRAWTGSDGAINGPYMPNPTFAVFQGSAGTVTVDTGAGALAATGMQFAADGYRIQGGPIELEGAGGESIVRVGDGTAQGGGVTATIASSLTGASALVKRDLGTLVLSGSNSYTGGTTIADGTLRVEADANLGASSGGLTFSGGALAATGSFDTLRAVSLASDGVFDVSSGVVLGLDGVVSGVGDLVKLGTGTLTLGGANAYRDTIVEAGTLIGDAVATSGDVSNAGTVVFDQAVNATLAGSIGGLSGTDGGMVKRGAGTLTLGGISSLDWAIDDGGLSTAANRFGGDVAIGTNGRLTFDQAVGGFYAGALSGSGQFLKTGSGALSLTGDSSGYAGDTAVTGGTLTIAGILGGDTTVSGAVLTVNGTLGGDAAIDDAGTLAGSGTISGAVTVAGDSTLAGVAGGTLEMGSLSLAEGSTLDVSLRAAGDPTLFDVAGDLTLDGTLNVMDAGGFGAGIYRLFDYGGVLTDNGLTLGGTPGDVQASDLSVQTALAAQVNLVSTAGAALSFWDGGNAVLHDNDAIDGGSGAWTLGGRNWTGMDGAVNGPYKPNPSLAVFGGAAGTVVLDADGLAATGLQFASGGYQLTGGSLELVGANGATAIRVGDGSAASATMTATISSSLTGEGALVKSDQGTLVLTGDNSYGGGTQIQGGVLQVSSDSNLGTAAGGLTLAGGAMRYGGGFASARSVLLASLEGRIDTNGYDALLSGSVANAFGTDGTLVKLGTGTLTLAGISSLDWSVEAGRLVSASDRFRGDVAIGTGGSFIFDQAVGGSYAGSLSGAGQLSFTGGGAVRLTGDSSGFAGLSTVTSSTLVVDDMLGGVLLVGDGGRLQGSGTVGSTTLASGSTVAPGNSIGTLSVAGDLTFLAGSAYEVEVNPAGTDSDRIAVTGTAFLEGGSVVHVGMTGAYDPTSTYTILTAGAGVAGTFDAVSSRFAFLDPMLGYGANDVTLTLERNDVGFGEVGETRNQIAAAEGVESLNSGNAVFDAVVQLDATNARAAFDQLSGEGHASVKTALIEESRFVRDAATNRIRAAFSQSDLASTSGQREGLASMSPGLGPQVWLSGFGSWGESSGDGNAAKLDRDTGGVLVGLDGLVRERFRIGLMAGYSASDIDVGARSFAADVDSYHVGVYGGTELGGFGVRAGAAYSFHEIETQRSVDFLGFADGLEADTDAATAQVFGEIGYGIDVGAIAFEPFAGLAYVHLDTDGFSESGGAAALTSRGDDTETSFSTLGLRAATAFDLGGMNATARGTVGWRHAFGDTTPLATNAFASGAAFTVAGVPIAEDAAIAEAGFDVDFSQNATLGLSYNGQFGDGAKDHGARLDFSFRF